MNEIKDLREQRMQVYSQMKSTLEDTRTSGMSADESEKYAKLEAEYLRLTSDIDARERAAKIEEALAKPTSAPEGIVRAEAQQYVDAQRLYKRAFDKWVRGQADELSNEERRILREGRVEHRDLSVGTGSAGGYLVPQEFSNRIFEHLKYYGAMREVAGSITTSSGADLIWPNVDDTGNVGAILAENAAISEQDMSFGARTFKAWMYTSKLIQVSWQLMQDSAFDLDAFLGRKLAERLGRIQNTHFTTGTGATQPEGFVTNATTVATDANDALELTDVLKLIYNVDRAYRSNGVLQMNDAVRLHLLKEQATTGEFVWQESAQVGEPARLFGYPVYTNTDMAATPTTDAAKVVAFGDFRNGYVIRDVKGVSLVRLNERYADNLQTGFFAYMRTDGQPAFNTASTQPPYKVLVVA